MKPEILLFDVTLVMGGILLAVCLMAAKNIRTMLVLLAAKALIWVIAIIIETHIVGKGHDMTAACAIFGAASLTEFIVTSAFVALGWHKE